MTNYSAAVRLQPPRVEEITELKEMVKTLINRFAKEGGLPARIIFFRDGVSEGRTSTAGNVLISSQASS